MTNDNIPDHRALRDWAMRQPDPARRFAAITAYHALRCIADGRSSAATMDVLAHSVAKMQGGE